MESSDSRPSVTVVVLAPGDARVLLLRREDFRLWALPGGHPEPGEPLEAAAAREVREETGHTVRVERLLAIYDRPQLGDRRTEHVYLARPTDEPPAPPGPEALEVRWFPPRSLPRPLLFGTREAIQDALAPGAEVPHRTIRLSLPALLALRAALWLRTLRNRLLGDPNRRAGR